MEDDYEETIFEEIEEGLFNDGDLTINEEYLTSYNAACDDVCTNAEAGRDIIQRMMDKCGGLVDFGSDRDALEAFYKKLCRVGNYKAAMNRYVTAVSEFDRNLADRFIAIRSEGNDQENKEWTDINEELSTRAANLPCPMPFNNVRNLRTKYHSDNTKKTVSEICDMIKSSHKFKRGRKLNEVEQDSMKESSG